MTKVSIQKIRRFLNRKFSQEPFEKEINMTWGEKHWKAVQFSYILAANRLLTSNFFLPVNATKTCRRNILMKRVGGERGKKTQQTYNNQPRVSKHIIKFLNQVQLVQLTFLLHRDLVDSLNHNSHTQTKRTCGLSISLTAFAIFVILQTAVKNVWGRV